MKRTIPDLPDATLEQDSLVSTAPAPDQARNRTRGFVVALVFALLFYFLEYAVRSSPSVMILQLSRTFHTTALGVSSILSSTITHIRPSA